MSELLFDSSSGWRQIIDGMGAGVLVADPETRRFVFANQIGRASCRERV